MLESKFQNELIKDLERLFPGCIVLKNDTSYIQGFPDLTILYEDRYAILEGKKYRNAPVRPNQRYYIKYFNDRAYGAFIYPENKEEILNELQQALEPGRETCFLKR